MPNTKMRKLVEQYKSDVEQRIACLEDEFVNNYDNGDFRAQMAHWKTTLRQINNALKGVN